MHKYVIKPKLNKVQLLKYRLECPFRDIALKLTGSLSQFRAKSKLDTRNRVFNNPLLVHSSRSCLMDDRHELCMFKICRSKALFLAPLFNDISSWSNQLVRSRLKSPPDDWWLIESYSSLCIKESVLQQLNLARHSFCHKIRLFVPSFVSNQASLGAHISSF